MYDRAMRGEVGKRSEEALGPVRGIREDILDERTSELGEERGHGISQMPMTESMKQTPGSKDTKTGKSAVCVRGVGPESGHSRG